MVFCERSRSSYLSAWLLPNINTSVTFLLRLLHYNWPDLGAFQKACILVVVLVKICMLTVHRAHVTLSNLSWCAVKMCVRPTWSPVTTMESTASFSKGSTYLRNLLLGSHFLSALVSRITACTVVQAVVKANNKVMAKDKFRPPWASKPLHLLWWNFEYIDIRRGYAHTCKSMRRCDNVGDLGEHVTYHVSGF